MDRPPIWRAIIPWAANMRLFIEIAIDLTDDKCLSLPSADAHPVKHAGPLASFATQVLADHLNVSDVASRHLSHRNKVVKYISSSIDNEGGLDLSL